MGNKRETELPKKLAAPARRALEGAGYRSLEQIATARESDLAKLHGMGQKAMAVLRDELKEHGLRFRS
jgi:ERCC4-type nuclease